MKPFFACILLAVLFTACKTSSQTKSVNVEKNQDCPLFVKYTTWQGSILIEGQTISQSQIQHEYDNPVSSTPSSSETVNLLEKVALNDDEIDQLERQIVASKFMDLSEGAYGAEEGSRYYPYEIEITKNCETRKILFRSNPSFKDVPSEFKEMEKILNQFAANKRN